MSDVTVTTWKCDRCDNTVETAPRDQPAGWVQLRVLTPPKANPNERGSTLEDLKLDLCPTCLVALRDFAAAVGI